MTHVAPTLDLRTRWLARVASVGLMVLVAVTSPLWFGRSAFPAVPAFSFLAEVPGWVDACFAGALVWVACTGTFGIKPRFVWPAIAGSLLILAALNQHRAQVWAWHLGLSGLIAVFSRPGKAIPRLRWLVISIYAWSAVSKFDAGFAAGPGRLLTSGLLTALQVDVAALPPTVASAIPWMMPAGELLTALALAMPRLRTVGLVMSLVMHLALLAAVGPLGLHHEEGVQIWNVLFIVQNLILFWPRTPTGVVPVAEPVPESGRALGDRTVGWLMGMAIVMPAFQPWNLWDVWPSWAVYSTRGGYTTLFVRNENIADLPPEVRPFVGEPPPLSDWHPIDIDAWSLASMHCPVYPQPRFRLAVAAALSRHTTIRVERRFPPDRWTGQYRLETLDVAGGRLPDEVERESWLNTRPR